jgi:AbrB family looped-hinge helix DNA binding protein
MRYGIINFMRHKPARRKKSQPVPGLAEEGKPLQAAPRAMQSVELGPGGRVVIPAPMRAALGMKVGDKLTVRLEDNELRIYTYAQGIRRIQEMVRKYVPDYVGTVDEFLAERRREAAKELKELGDE